MFETRKILEDESIGIAVTCVRVPVRTGHSEAVNIQTREPLSAERRHRAAPRLPGWRGRRPRETCTRRRCAPPAATRCSSAGSGATPRTRGRSACSSSATTCARAPPPTRCRSPSCWSETARPRALADELYELMRCAPSTRYFTDENGRSRGAAAGARERALRPQRRQPPGLEGDRRHRPRQAPADARALRAALERLHDRDRRAGRARRRRGQRAAIRPPADARGSRRVRPHVRPRPGAPRDLRRADGAGDRRQLAATARASSAVRRSTRSSRTSCSGSGPRTSGPRSRRC